MCHMLRPYSILDTCLRPQGHDQPGQLAVLEKPETEHIWGFKVGEGITDGSQ